MRLLVLAALAAPALGAQAARSTGPLADSLRIYAFQMVDALRRLDAGRALGFYGDTAHFVHVEDGNVIPWSRLAADVRQYFANATTNPISIVGEPGVVVIDRDNAVLYVVHRMEAAHGRPMHEGVWTGVLHRFPAGWRIVHSHSSDRRAAGR